MIARLYAVAYILGWFWSIAGLWGTVYWLFPGIVPATIAGWEGVARVAIFFAVLYAVMFVTAIQVMKKAVKKGRELRQRRVA